MDITGLLRDSEFMAAQNRFKAADEIDRLRHALTWSLRHTGGKELRRMVGDLHDTSDLDEFIRAIERAESE